MKSIKTTAALAALLALGLVAAAPAFATTAIEHFETSSSTSQAGGHPDLFTSFELAAPGEPEAAKNITFTAPKGVFGNINAVTTCESVDFALDQCPSNSQIGLITVRANYEGQPNFLLGTAPMYDITPADEETARFSFSTPILGIPISIPVEVRTGSDFGLNFTVSEITQITPLQSAKLSFWGFPAAPVHQPERFPKGTPGDPSNCPGIEDTTCLSESERTRSSLPVHPFIDNPSECTEGPLQTKIEVQTYQDPDNVSTATSDYPQTTGCDRVTFKPLLQAQPTTKETDAASGLNLELSARQIEGFAVVAVSLKKTSVAFPEGFTINPDAADGQTACTEEEANFGSEGPEHCPDQAKIGTLSIGSPTLNGTLDGSVYIGEPEPGNQYRLFLMASEFGMNVKLKGSVVPDPATGRITTHFENLPEVPFETFDLHLFAGERALMATPTHCGIYTVDANFFPWDNVLADQTTNQSFALNSGPHGSNCPGQTRPFKPRLVAGTSNPNAAEYSKFTLKLDRDDGDQFLGDLNFKMPPGFTGSLRGISYCPEGAIAAAATNQGLSEQAAPSCPLSSQIGTTNVAAGPGSHPFHAVGRMFLAGPFKGAPLSLAAVTPALAGPYDYGVVVVRVALHIDPLTAQVSAVSDTVPSIIGGIPIRMRSIQVNIDREHFTVNPTNCSAFSVDSQGIGDQATVADFFSPFQAVNCATLPFKPAMKIRQVGGKKSTNRGANPALRFDLTTRDGDANIKSISVILPKAFEIDQRHLGNLCSEKELAATRCEGRQRIGTATTTTPLLDQPLAGPVYAVSGSGGLPRLAFLLDGQVNLQPRADTDTFKGKLRTTVPVIPDATIGHFRLNVFGGKQGYLANTRSLCGKTPIETINYVAQNGQTLTQKVKTKVACGGKGKGSKKARAKH